MTFALAAYRTAAWALEPFAGAALRARARAGKEDGGRLAERFGRAAARRPEGALVWLHGASVGETRVLMTLRDALSAAREDLSFLFTSGTRTSAGLFARNPTPRTIHQFAPVDAPAAVGRFLDHWRPDLAIFAESELWPNLVLGAAKRGVRLALVNARMSPRSLANWARLPSTARALFGAFDVALAADARTSEGLSILRGRAVPAPGNLKLAAPPPSIDPAALQALKAAIRGRPVWVAASTHPGEDEIVLAAHRALARPEALLILVPRHPERSEAVAALANGAPRRSRVPLPPASASVFVVDTMGELGLFYAAAPLALVAGSLLPHLKGHNPAEPVRLGSAVISGRHVESFADVYAALAEAGGVTFADDAAALAGAVSRLLLDDRAREESLAAARTSIAKGAAALDETLQALAPLLPPR